MDDTYFNRINRILSCHVKRLSPEQGKQLTDLVDEKVKAHEKKVKADESTKTKPSGSAGNK